MDRRAAGCPHQQPVLLSRSPAAAAEDGHPLDGDLELWWRPEEPSAEPDRAIAFRIQWADLWLFPDADDLVSTAHKALLAFKVEPLSAQGAASELGVGDLAGLKGALRDLDRGQWGSPLIRPIGSDEPPGSCGT